MPAILLVLASLAAGYYLATALYSLSSLHPLADVPGPKLCAVSRLPYWLASVRGEDVGWMKRLHDAYGPVVRFGPADLSYTAAQAWQDIHGPRVTEKALEFSVQPVNGVPSMLTQTTDNHSRVRRLFSPAFSDRALKQQEPLFRKYADLLVYKIGEVGGANDADGTRGQLKPVDMTRLLNFTTFDVMAELCFGESLGLLARNEYSPWLASVFGSLRMLPVAALINYYPLLKAVFDRVEPRAVTKQRIAHCRHAEERVDKRLQRGSENPDVWSLVLDAEENGKGGLTIEEMHSNAELFMLAGSETTATLLSGLLFYLLKDPTRLDILTEEIRGTFGSQDDITLDSLASLKYANACIKEGLRIYPPVPIGSPRIVPPGGQRILGKWVPAGTRVSVHHWSTYRSEDNFRDAGHFVPERWLKDVNDNTSQKIRYAGDAGDAHQPFGFGPRNCLGQNMAMHEMRLLLVTLLFRYDLALVEQGEGEGSPPWPQQLAFVLWVKKPLLVRATPVRLTK